MIHIRSAQAADVPALAGILAQAGYPVAEQILATRLESYLADARSDVLVADDGGRLLGMACAHVIPLLHDPHPLCRMTILAVVETCRRRGIGRLLLASVEEFARLNGCRRVEITSAEHRATAHAFCRALGYQEIERRFVRPFECATAGWVTPRP
ncbi:MAG: GNAT family N-acetyltransferase [Candidatus Sericytochromatia bacterium]|nr:GNAT family N-acetyltransferase [Candidatus Tanganyikabacteria bacterium]